MRMANVHHFAYGWFNPALAYLLSVAGGIIGLGCAARARAVSTRGRRRRWLLVAAVAFGASIWLLHFMAMFGFDVPASPIRYDVGRTAASMAIAIAGIGAGLLAGTGETVSVFRIGFGGVIAGAGAVAMHYTGIAAIHLTGTVTHDRHMTTTAATIGLVAGVVLIAFAATVRGGRAVVAAAFVIATALSAMHYTAMAGVRVHLDPITTDAVDGIRPILLVVPVAALAAVALLGFTVSAIQAMTEEELEGHGAGTAGREGAHASTPTR